MAVSYNKLWKLLIDRNMKKKELIAQSGVCKSTIAKICRALSVNIEDIVEVIPDKE